MCTEGHQVSFTDAYTCKQKSQMLRSPQTFVLSWMTGRPSKSIHTVKCKTEKSGQQRKRDYTEKCTESYYSMAICRDSDCISGCRVVVQDMDDQIGTQERMFQGAPGRGQGAKIFFCFLYTGNMTFLLYCFFEGTRGSQCLELKNISVGVLFIFLIGCQGFSNLPAVKKNVLGSFQGGNGSSRLTYHQTNLYAPVLLELTENRLKKPVLKCVALRFSLFISEA